MPISDSDPRVFFAAERTLLAWLRTSLTVIAIGFVIARFGLFLRLLSLQAPNGAWEADRGASALLGILFVIVGTVAALAATVQHRRFIATLPLADLPPSYSGGLAVGLGVLMSLLGGGLAVYLALTA